MRPPNKVTPSSPPSFCASDLPPVSLGSDSLNELFAFSDLSNDSGSFEVTNEVPHLKCPESSGVHSDAADTLETRVTVTDIAEVRERVRMGEDTEPDDGPPTIPDGPPTMPDVYIPDTDSSPLSGFPFDIEEDPSDLDDTLPCGADVNGLYYSDDESTLVSSRNEPGLTAHMQDAIVISVEEAAPSPMSKAAIRARLALALLIGAGVTYVATSTKDPSSHSVCVPSSALKKASALKP